jgi:Ca2+-binding RTX toxin-like protein
VQWQYGGADDDHVGGDIGTDYGFGDVGNDIVWGGRDNDFSYGGSGNDSVHGNIGNDYAYGGSGKDDVLGSKGDDVVFGDSGKDYVSGNTGNDIVFGGSGKDNLRGGSGDDIILPGGGKNEVQGGGGNDTLSYADIADRVVIDLGEKVYNKAAQGEKVRNVENVIGSQGDDKLTPDKRGSVFGEGGDDVLNSAKGSVMRGDAGNDKLKGHNGGKDVFWLTNDGGTDTLSKFKSGQDKVRLDGSDFGIGDSLDTGELINSAGGHDANQRTPQLIYDQADKSLWFDPDGTGGQAAHKLADFKGGPGSLSVSDFDIV